MDEPIRFQPEVEAFVADLLKEDDLGAVVRVHIRIEFALRELVKSLVVDPEFLKKLDLDYSHTVQVAGALGINKAYIPSLNALGTLRNNFAHDLKTELDSNAVSALYSSLAPDHKEDVQRVSEELWVSHKIGTPYPGFKKLEPRDRFVTIALVVWGAAVGAVLHLRDQSTDA